MPSRAGVSAYITKIHIIDTVQHAYDVALDIGTTAWSFVKSRFDDPTSASQPASFVHFDYNAVEVVHLPSEQRATPPPTRTIGDSAHCPYSSVLTAPAPTVLCKSLSPGAVYRMDGGVRSDDHLYLLHFLAMAVIAFCLVLLRKFLFIMVSRKSMLMLDDQRLTSFDRRPGPDGPSCNGGKSSSASRRLKQS